MSWSLQLRHGDFTLDGVKFGKATGADKLTQDLRCAILTHMGFDEAHPAFGSLIDGGTQNGQRVPSLLATNNWQRLTATVESEIRRIIQDYQRKQLDRSQRDTSIYGHSTLDPDEICLGIQNFEFFQANDALLVRVTLQTARNQITLNIPLAK